jgi:hypothetical protein
MGRIEWIKAAAGRRPGYVEEFGQEETVDKWVKAGMVKRVTAPATSKVDVKGPMSHKSMSAPPFNRAIQAPVKRTPARTMKAIPVKKRKAKAKTRRRW